MSYFVLSVVYYLNVSYSSLSTSVEEERAGFSAIDYSLFLFLLEHYENTPMQYTAIFHGCKNVHFQMKNCDIFLIFAQNIDCGYTLEPPQ